MNTSYKATLQSGGGATIHMKIFHKPKRKKKENFSKTRKSNFMVGGSEKEFFTLTWRRFYT